jgi:uncharacterized protein with ParB-like and HNH nuclease domain
MELMEIEPISIDKIFNDVKYVIPIYQRNYAWEKDQIEQLIEDIVSFDTTEYFLGNLIVDKREDRTFVVIDGQQRLTTLALIEKYFCGEKTNNSPISFEARPLSGETIKRLHNKFNDEGCENYAEEILRGFFV